MRTLYLTCTILSMIWTLGDFNSVYLLTGGGPADLTHVLATLGIRYLRLDQVDLSMAAIVVRAAAGAAARVFHDEAAVAMMIDARACQGSSWGRRTGAKIATEAKLLLIGIPVLLWTLLPIYHLFLFAISPKESALGGKLWPDHPTLQQLPHRVHASSITTSSTSGGRCGTRCSSRSPSACSRCSSPRARRSRSAGSRCAAAAR